MTRTRLVVVVTCLCAAAAMAYLGLTDGKLTELQYAWPAPLVVGLLALVTAPRPPEATPFSPADWSGAHAAQLHALATLHGFTPAHLEANRAGQLHPQQQAAGLQQGRSDARIGWVLLTIGAVLAAAGFALPFFPRALQDQDFHFAWPAKPGVAVFIGAFLAGVLGCLPLLFGFVSWREGRRIEAGYLTGRVSVAEGVLEKLVIRRRRGATSWHFVVNGVRLEVPRSAWEQTKVDGPVRVYFAHGHGRLLGIEPRYASRWKTLDWRRGS